MPLQHNLSDKNMKGRFKFITLGAASLLAAMAMQSCGDKANGWTIEGTIDGGANRKIAVEQNVSGAWVLLDSIETDDAGHFSYTAQNAAEFPDLYRLSLDNSWLYFPVDSLDHVTVTTTAADFGGRYQLKGSTAAENITRANQLIYHYIDSLDLNRALADSSLKVRLFDIFREGDDLMTPYYLVYRNIDGRPLFDIQNRDTDYRVLGAVATKFQMLRPDDPRTKFFERLHSQERQRRNPVQLVATEVNAPGDIQSLDITGNKQSLYDLLGKGKPVVLSFAKYGDDTSKPYTLVLNSVYEKYKDQGLELYQVSVDGDETEWIEFGRNLPWISVWGPAITTVNPLTLYNVSAVPMTYIFDAQGNLAERVVDYSKLDQALAKYF